MIELTEKQWCELEANEAKAVGPFTHATSSLVRKGVCQRLRAAFDFDPRKG